MLRMNRKLSKLKMLGDKIDIAIVGLGKMGQGLVHQLMRIDGICPLILVDEDVDKAYQTLITSGIKEEDIVITNKKDQVNLALKNGSFVVSEDYSLALDVPRIRAVVDATGNPPFGAQLAYESIQAKKDIIMLNVECDSLVGPVLNKYASENDVVYTGSAGDEPGAIMELVDFSLSLGFDLKAVGKGKNNPLNHYITEDELREEAESKGLYPKILASFVDGTNTMIELNTVCNAIGFKPDVMGCHGIKTTPKTIAQDLSLKSQGGILNSYGVVDFAFGMAPGVFAIVSHESQEVRDLMKYMSMGDGPNYCIYRPYHLTSLETPITIYRAVVERESTIAPLKGQEADVVALAKRDLKKGQSLEGMGGRDLFGQLTSHQSLDPESYLPLALIGKRARLKRDIKKDEILKIEDVDLDEGQFLYRLRKKQEDLGL